MEVAAPAVDAIKITEMTKADEVMKAASPRAQEDGVQKATDGEEKPEEVLQVDEVAAGIQALAMDQVVEFTMEDVAAGVQWAKMSLLGRLFMDNPPSLAVISKIVNGEWNCAVEVRVLAAERGLLQFFFADEADLDWVLKRSPWTVKERVLQLKPWCQITKEVVDSFIMVPLWVQMWGIPNHCRTVAFGKRVAGSKIGKVLEAGAFAIQGISGHFIKTKVLLDITQPLRSQLYASNPLVGEFWVTLVYEFLPLLCYHCGRLGHMAPNCVYPDPMGIEHYGPELSTDIIGYRVEEAAVVPFPLRQPAQSSVWVNPNSGANAAGGGKQKRGREAEEDPRGGRDKYVVLGLPAQGSLERGIGDLQGKSGQGQVHRGNVVGGGSGYRGQFVKGKGKGGQGNYQQANRGLERSRESVPRQQQHRYEARRPHGRQTNDAGPRAAGGGPKSKGKEAFRMVAPDPAEIDERKRAAGEVAGLQFDPTPVKKMCVEAAVEETSHEWSQPAK
ncbi:unnamed protein product [Linum trigynum]|uniref:CCHC-type domain-containing protein n=1 Tax=Linum trigynum TaxID=586398 RepID=A0AAV2FMT7_9ROSI